jgi:hypothetical protein
MFGLVFSVGLLALAGYVIWQNVLLGVLITIPGLVSLWAARDPSFIRSNDGAKRVTIDHANNQITIEFQGQPSQQLVASETVVRICLVEDGMRILKGHSQYSNQADATTSDHVGGYEIGLWLGDNVVWARYLSHGDAIIVLQKLYALQQQHILRLDPVGNYLATATETDLQKLYDAALHISLTQTNNQQEQDQLMQAYLAKYGNPYSSKAYLRILVIGLVVVGLACFLSYVVMSNK